MAQINENGMGLIIIHILIIAEKSDIPYSWSGIW